LIEGWVGPRTGLDVNRGEKNLATAGNWTLVFHPIICCYTDGGVLADIQVLIPSCNCLRVDHFLRELKQSLTSVHYTETVNATKEALWIEENDEMLHDRHYLLSNVGRRYDLETKT
jgi:hypothetical protein